MSKIIYNTDYFKLDLVDKVNTCLLMSALEEYFKQAPQGFKKNLCKSKTNVPIMRVLGMGEAQIKSALGKICKRFKGTKEFDDAEDMFDGKYYCMFFNPRYSETCWIRNHKLLDGLLEEVAI